MLKEMKEMKFNTNIMHELGVFYLFFLSIFLSISLFLYLFLFPCFGFEIHAGYTFSALFIILHPSTFLY